MTFLGSVIVLVYLLLPFVASQYTGIVETSSGPVRGPIYNTVNNVAYAAFIGIGYAEPPINKLRFKPPVAIRPWTDTLIADVPQSVCPQLIAGRGFFGSEDCLYLNVYTPVTNPSEIPTKRKSVMVWIHEGSFSHGSGNMGQKKPDFLLEKDIVLVSMNYRLGALGFVSLDHRKATGNQGLKDQRLALEWVQKNIEKFGGDPESVTIFGQEAGAASVGYHVLSDASKGLFHAAISMGGTPLAPRSFVSAFDAVRRGKELAITLSTESAGFRWTKSESLRLLYSANAHRLVVASVNVDRHAAFLPTVEDPAIATDVFLSDQPTRKYRSGKFNKVPQLLGVAEPTAKQYAYDKEEFYPLIKKAIKDIRKKNGKNPEALRLIKKLTKRYGHGSDAKHNVLVAYAEYATFDILVNSPMQETRNLLVNSNGNQGVYYYKCLSFTKVPPSTSENNLDPNDHAYPADLDSIFHIPRNNNNLSSTASIADSVVTMWTNFAKFRNPTPYPLVQNSSNITWLPWDRSEHGLKIGKRIEMAVLPTNVLFDRKADPYDLLWQRKDIMLREE